MVLGAACGEAVLGKKIGNKALLFGAIGGTIPDLDVVIGHLLYTNEIEAMAFHRGFMHSIVFALVAGLGLGVLTFWGYNRVKRHGTTTKIDWIKLFVVSIFTHPILDCFTAYGTQLFAPFSNYRVAFNTISVADPFYTLPFLLALIVLMFFKRESSRRRLFLKIGVGLSSLYMGLTIVNKGYVNKVYKNSLIDHDIPYVRFQTQPTILNNILWYGIAETSNDYYVAFYSIFDQTPQINNWIQLPKNHELISEYSKDLEILYWFSNGYYNFSTLEGSDEFMFKDLRYPLMTENDPESTVFKFKIQKYNGRWNAEPFYRPDVSDDEYQAFWERIKGI